MVDENEWLCYYRCKLNEAEKKQHTNSSGFLLTGYFPAEAEGKPGKWESNRPLSLKLPWGHHSSRNHRGDNTWKMKQKWNYFQYITLFCCIFRIQFRSLEVFRPHVTRLKSRVLQNVSLSLSLFEKPCKRSTCVFQFTIFRTTDSWYWWL